MEMHRIAYGRRVAQVAEVELSGHVVEQLVLCNKDELPVDMLESLNLVMHLDKNRFGRHLPIHSEGFGRIFRIIVARYSESVRLTSEQYGKLRSI